MSLPLHFSIQYTHVGVEHRKNVMEKKFFRVEQKNLNISNYNFAATARLQPVNLGVKMESFLNLNKSCFINGADLQKVLNGNTCSIRHKLNTCLTQMMHY